MSGFVARDLGTLSASGKDEIQFLSTKKGDPKIFRSRAEACTYLQDMKHMAVDDLLHMYWYEENTMEKINLFTGEYIDGFKKSGDQILALNFWKCESCGVIYRVYSVPCCQLCGSLMRFNVTSDMLEESSILTKRERKQLKEILLYSV